MSLTAGIERFGGTGTTPQTSRDGFRTDFKNGAAKTSIWYSFNTGDGADVTIEDIITLPEDQRRKGAGARALRLFVSWAESRGYTKIRAQSAQAQGQGLAEKVGFSPVADRSWSNDYQYEAK